MLRAEKVGVFFQLLVFCFRAGEVVECVLKADVIVAKRRSSGKKTGCFDEHGTLFLKKKKKSHNS